MYCGEGDFIILTILLQVSWHVPTNNEIDFALRIFKELVEPTLESLEGLLKPGEDHPPSARIYLSDTEQVLNVMLCGGVISVG